MASNLAFLASCQIPPSQRAFIRARIRVAIATPVDAVKPSPRAQLLPRPLPSPRSFSRARETFAVRAQLLPRVDIEYFEDAASVSLAVTLALIKMCRVNEILGSKKNTATDLEKTEEKKKTKQTTRDGWTHSFVICQVKYGKLLEMAYYFTCHNFCQVAKHQDLPSEI